MQFRHPLYGFFLVCGSCTLCFGGTTYTVDAGGGGDYMTIQDAVDVAVSGDAIEIDPGTYIDDDADGVIVAISGKDLTIAAPSGGVTLDGDETAQGFVVINATAYLYRLDLLDCAASEEEGSYGGGGLLFKDVGGSGENLWVISCTFTNCSSPVEFTGGGAIQIYGNSFSHINYEIDDCQFISCESATYAGAFYAKFANGLIMNTSFINCSAGTAGACELRAGTSDIYECVFQGNSTTGDGGAIRVYSSDADITIEDSSFSENQARYGSAIYQSTGDVALSNCEITDNMATYNGCLHLRDNDVAAIIEVSGCWFSGNETDSWTGYAGISGDVVVNLTVSDSTLCDHPQGGDISIAYTDGGGNELGDWCCPGDVDEDGDVDSADLVTLLDGYGDGSLDADDREDCSRDGDVDVADLIGLLSQWGTCE
jgi:predicted outer membrane repeat protein